MTSDRPARAARWSAWLMLSFGALFGANAVMTAVRGVGTVIDVAFAALLLTVAAWIAVGLGQEARWAKWAALALGGVGLFFVLPVAGTILLGGALDPVGTGWDVVYFPLTAIVLVALLTVLSFSRSAADDGRTSTLEES